MDNTPLLRLLASWPAPYETDGEPFWEDEHISKQMLAAHLNPDLDAASRPDAFLDRSAAWLEAQFAAAPGRELLDLGCGPGLYARRFARMGRAVTGVDISPRSIAYARENAAREGLSIRYLVSDYRTLEFREEFGAAMLIYCDYGVLSPADRHTVLRRMCRALRPGGIFAVDAYGEPHGTDFPEGSQAAYQERGFWSPEPHLCISRSRLYRETGNTLDQYVVVSETGCRRWNIWNQIFTPEQLRTELEAAGLEWLGLYGDAAGAPYDPAGDTMCAVARRPL